MAAWNGIRSAGAATLPALLAALLAGCGDFMDTEAPGRRGFASVAVSLAPVDGALGKRSAAADTTVQLRTLHLEFSSTGLPLQYREVALAGDIHAGSIAPASQVFALWGPRNWKVKAWTQDAADSVIHEDSTTFYVEPGDTAALAMSLQPRYSVLIGRFLSESNKVTAIEKLELRVNGRVVDDTTFLIKLRTFDVALSSKYLRLGQPSTVELRAIERLSPLRVKYSKTVIIDPDVGVESMMTIKLD